MILKIVAAAACLAFGIVLVPPIAAARGGASSCVATPPGEVALDAEQRSNLAVVVATGDQLQIDQRGMVIAVMTALTESSLRNVDHGDAAGPDSRGLFQQRNGWGPLTVRMDPEGASVLFYSALLNVPGWVEMDPWLAAQEVQRSAFSDGRNYKANYLRAQTLVGASPESICGPSPAAGDTGDLPDADAAIARALSLVGQRGYYQLCARLAANIWGRPRAGYVSAAEQWSQMVASGNAHLNRRPPLGALVFWSTEGVYGHVAVYVGDGRIVSNDIHDQFPGEGGVYLVDLDTIEAEWDATYLGWAPPIYQGPAA